MNCWYLIRETTIKNRKVIKQYHVVDDQLLHEISELPDQQVPLLRKYKLRPVDQHVPLVDRYAVVGMVELINGKQLVRGKPIEEFTGG